MCVENDETSKNVANSFSIIEDVCEHGRHLRSAKIIVSVAKTIVLPLAIGITRGHCNIFFLLLHWDSLMVRLVLERVSICRCL